VFLQIRSFDPDGLYSLDITDLSFPAVSRVLTVLIILELLALLVLLTLLIALMSIGISL